MSISFASIILNSSNNFNLFFLIFKKTQKIIPNNKSQFECTCTTVKNTKKFLEEPAPCCFFVCIFLIQWEA